MFKTEQREGRTIGYSFETADAYFFFGTKETSRATLPALFPQYRFSFLKQVHGRRVIEASASNSDQEADGQYTSTRALALVVQTADCVPVLIANSKSVCGIHSGWKGSAQNIVGEAKDVFRETAAEIALIGPHILRNNFEVGQDVAQTLLSATTEQQGLCFPHANPDKTYFDLTEMVRRQLRDSLGSSLQILEFLRDTLTDSEFHSFRRDKDKSGRQYSFVVLKE